MSLSIHNQFPAFTLKHTPGELLNPLEVMSNHKNGGSALANLLEYLHDLVAGLWVQIAGGLIGQNQFGVIKQGAGYAYTLLLSAGEFMRHLVSFGIHAYQSQYLENLLVYELLVFPACGFENKTQIIKNVAVSEQLEILEYYTHLAAQTRYLALLDGHQVHTQHYGVAVRHRAEYVKFSVQGLEQAALARAYFAYQIDKITLLNGECDIAQDEHILLAYLNVTIINNIHLFFMTFYQFGGQFLNAVPL